MRNAFYAFGLMLIVTIPASAGEVVAKMELMQTGESARVHNPACATGASLTAADLILKAGATAIDAYLGQPLATTILGRVPAGNQDWIKVRLGIHDGKSTCATQCVVYPKDVHATRQVCFSETGGNGLGCFQGVTDNADPPAWAAIQSFTVAATGNSAVFCATGKNWSRNRNRWFTVKASW